MQTKKDKPRTIKQNSAIHLLFQMIADELNEAGLDMKKTLKPEIDIPWNGTTVKDYLWRPLMKAQLGIDSTTEMNTKDIDKVFATLHRHLAEKFGITLEFPSIETIMNNQRIQQ